MIVVDDELGARVLMLGEKLKASNRALEGLGLKVDRTGVAGTRSHQTTVILSAQMAEDGSDSGLMHTLLHEAGHINLGHTTGGRGSTKALRARALAFGCWWLALCLSAFAYLAMRQDMSIVAAGAYAGVDGLGIFAGLVVIVLAVFAQFRRMEYDADVWALEHGATVSGLQRGIEESLRLEPGAIDPVGINEWFCTHPNLADRMQRMRQWDCTKRKR